MEEKKKEGEIDQNIKIVSVRLDHKPRVYSNYVEVSTSQIDMSLKFCDVVSPSNEEKEKIKREGKIEAPVQVEVVIPLSIAGELLKVLETQLKKEGGK